MPSLETGQHQRDPTTARWLPTLLRSRPAGLRLFAFPYAGGDAISIFRTWLRELPAGVQVCPVQIPGRGARISEPLFTQLNSMIDAAGKILRPHLDKPFAFFGHSMGALISFELARWLRREHGIQPQFLFVSGHGAPQIPRQGPPTYDMPEAEFVAELKRINGTPEEVWDHPELMSLMLPILRADFQVAQSYVYVDESPLDCPITVFGGLDDLATREDLESWRKQTNGRFALHMFPGGHFFLRAEQAGVLRIVSNALEPCMLG